MAKQALKQAARSTVREALTARAKQRIERERRQEALAVCLLSALAERDEAVAAAERAAAGPLQQLLADGLSVADVAAVCGGRIHLKELGRLAKLEVEAAS